MKPAIRDQTSIEEHRCSCVGLDPDCKRCKGLGVVKVEVKQSKFTLIIRHPGGEERELAVVSHKGNSLFLQWPMCGVYRLDLSSNQITTGGKSRAWGAKDIARAWEIYNDLQGNVGKHRRRSPKGSKGPM